MSFIVPSQHLLGPPCLNAAAMRLRYALFDIHDDVVRCEHVAAQIAAGARVRVPTTDIRRRIGPKSANDARAYARGAATLAVDPAFDHIALAPSGRELVFALAADARPGGYVERYALLDIATIAAARTALDLVLRVEIAAVVRMRAPRFTLRCDDLFWRLGRRAPLDAAWLRKTFLPTLARLADSKERIFFYVAANWNAHDGALDAVEVRIATSGHRLKAKSFEWTSPTATSWLVRAEGVTQLAKRRVIIEAGGTHGAPS